MSTCLCLRHRFVSRRFLPASQRSAGAVALRHVRRDFQFKPAGAFSDCHKLPCLCWGRLMNKGVTHVLIVRSTLERRLSPKFPAELKYQIVEVRSRRGSARERERLSDHGPVAGARGTNGKFDSLLPRVQCVHSASNCGRRQDTCALQCWPVTICSCHRRLCKMCTSRWLLCAHTSVGLVGVGVWVSGSACAGQKGKRNKLWFQAATL